MHCPNCGTRFSTEQKFCRACGLSLQPIAQLTRQILTENSSVSSESDGSASPASTARWSTSRVSAWLTFLGVGLFLKGLLLFALNKILRIDPDLDMPAVIACLLGTFVISYGALYSRLHAPKQISSLPNPVELPVAATTNDLGLLPATIPASSVVEHTTRHLEPILAERDDRNSQRN